LFQLLFARSTSFICCLIGLLLWSMTRLWADLLVSTLGQ
jgi:hypothetical protein